MFLVEQAPVASSDLPLADLKDHLKLGRGFSDDNLQDGVLEAALRSALSAVEARVSKAVFQRSFIWKLASWRGFRREALPLAPVSQITDLRIRESNGTTATVPAEQYALEPDVHRPCLAAMRAGLPVVPVGGGIEIEFIAGYGTNWDAIPPDLARAVFLLAAHFYENRHAEGDRQSKVLPFGVASLLEPYHNVRLFGWS